MEQFEERQIRMDQKLDLLLDWKAEHRQEHFRIRITVWGVLFAALVGVVLL